MILVETTNAEQIIILDQNESATQIPLPEPPAPDSQHRKENIVSRKTIVYETRVDPSVIRIAAEKIKQQLFTKFGLFGPKAEEIQFVSIDKYYQPYILINGKYSIDYYRKSMYTVRVDQEVKEVILLNNKFMPEPVEASSKYKHSLVKLEGEERILNEAKAYLILNDQGQETTSKSLPSAASEKNPKEIIENSGLKEFPQNIDVDYLKQKIAKRPSNVNRIVSENFEVTERSIIYTPRYKLKYVNSKTSQERTVEFDGVTSQRIL
jgi:hypothetical protein